MLTATNIIEGAYYAIEQSGQLLIDAGILYEHQRWPSSLALCVFALEEIGKAEALLPIAAAAAKTGPKNVAQVTRGLKDHLGKLRSARKITITASVSFWGERPTNTDELSRQLEDKLRMNRDSAPAQAHSARKSALFVDLLADEFWQRPAELGRNAAYDMLLIARIEYSRCRGMFLNSDDELIKEALAELAGRLPELPEVHRVERH